MNWLQDIDDILFGEDGYIRNEKHPSKTEYWESKRKDLADELSNKCDWEFDAEYELFSSVKKSSPISKLMFFVNDNNICNVLLGDRHIYYESKIKHACYSILNDISREIRNNTIDATDVIKRKVRWYIYETNRFSYKFYTPFSLLLNYEMSVNSIDEINAANFLLNVTLRDCLINLFEHLDIIDNKVDIDKRNDLFIINSLEDKKYADSSYGLFRFHIKKEISKGSMAILPELYKRIKSIFYYSYSTSTDLSNYDLLLMTDIQLLENAIFVKGFAPRIFDLEIANNLTSEQSDLFENCYTLITEQVRNALLPNERMFLIQNITNQLKTFLNDDKNSNNDLFFESVPRKLLRKLTLDYKTIEANPEIDLKELDKNSISPIQTTISVSHLALLFRLLTENSIIKSDQRGELYKTITKAFSSKSVVGVSISEKSFQNNFNDPDKGSYRFWATKFESFYKECKKII